MNSPRFDFYPSDWLGDTNVQAMSLEVEGAYIRLLAHAWQSDDCSLPDNAEILARFLRVSRRNFARIWADLTTGTRAVFVRDSDGNWRNPRLVREWKKAQQRAKQASEAAGARWHEQAGSTCPDDASASDEHGPSICPDDASRAVPQQPTTNNQEDKKTKTRADAREVVWVMTEFDRVFAGIWKRPHKLTDTRRRQIEARLRTFTVDELATAVANLRADSWNCGQNERGKVYATPEFLFRSDEKVEEWLQKSTPQAPAPKDDGLDWSGVGAEDLAVYRDSGRHQLTQAQVDVLKTRIGVDVIEVPDLGDEADEPP